MVMNMQGATQDRRVKRSKTLLQTTLVELMLEERSQPDFRQGADPGADVNRSTFYLHYLDIYDMLEQMEDEFVEGAFGFFS